MKSIPHAIRRTAWKPYRCLFCGQPIDIGTTHEEVFFGGKRQGRACIGCWGEEKGRSIMRVIDMITQYLNEHGYDGLFNARDDCACKTGEIEPCGSVNTEQCRAGYCAPCDCGDHDYHIVAEKPEPVCGESEGGQID
jgi:hypothetical protein